MAERGRNKKRGPLAVDNRKNNNAKELESLKKIGKGMLALTPYEEVKGVYEGLKDNDYVSAAINAGMLLPGVGPLAKAGKVAKRLSDPYLDLLTEKQPDYSYFFRGTTPKTARDLVDEGMEITQKEFHLTDLPTGAARYAGPQGEVIRVRMPKGSFPEGKRSVVDKNPEMMGMNEWVMDAKQANALFERDDVKIDRIPTSIIYSAIDKKK
jgi:hypothetical protein